ncbi:hypothetical protein NUW58_g832 [Xylaria curta]|uniref:Uncharacterized protein n=1 Tax=Xylaria curta TaxID=42375 RepID=A0ACC1PNQ9_9PEZI|nr:hypothetical protein NUW58_g832 [Xylaria curta]
MEYATVTYVTKDSMTAIGVLFPVLAVLALIARFYAWQHQPRKFALDDILIIPAAFLNIAAGVALVIGAQMNIIGGHSLPYITETEQVNLGKVVSNLLLGIIIRTLNMSFKRKVQTSLVFLGSGFAVIAGLLRLIPWVQIKIQDVTRPVVKILATDLSSADQEAVVSIVLFWTYVEIGTGFLVACLPRSAWVFDRVSLRPIFYKIRSLSSMGSLSKGDRPTHHSKEADTQRLQDDYSAQSMELSSRNYPADTSELVKMK